MATTTRQTVQRGAPPPRGRNAAPVPTVRDISSPTKGVGPFVSAFSIFHYGISGVGKTSMWAHLPNVGFVHDPAEEGILELVKFGRVPKPKMIQCLENWDHCMNFFASAANKEYPIDFLVVDSATGFENIIFHYHCDQNFEGNWSKEGFYGYQAGPKNAAKTDVPEFLAALDNVRRSGIGIVFIGHAQVKPFKNPLGADYDQYKPYLDVDTWQQIHRWAQNVFFHDLIVEVQMEKGKVTRKAAPETRRVIYTEPIGSCVAKSWWGLEGVIDCGQSSKDSYDNFVAAYKKALRKGGG